VTEKYRALYDKGMAAPSHGQIFDSQYDGRMLDWERRQAATSAPRRKKKKKKTIMM
jgi:hypothetical protein